MVDTSRHPGGEKPCKLKHPAWKSETTKNRSPSPQTWCCCAPVPLVITLHHLRLHPMIASSSSVVANLLSILTNIIHTINTLTE
ncbi:hypothetical protein ASPTUDRAFT_37964 [Aspergillus tubingensis CBS 134.48]|uniref:Uncharacterized protein n=1 Tax=Aspergillus tubingensis (strain CBS 134.48) TaxID=767770 RepID=A0A1L9NP96_ASPTC|nr:hypothetical protein ASPTUDRAFT_37964 [Aspergillus tubingensis CBS 134.48]